VSALFIKVFCKIQILSSGVQMIAQLNIILLRCYGILPNESNLKCTPVLQCFRRNRNSPFTSISLLIRYAFSVVMVALCNRADHYIFVLWFSSFFFLSSFSSPNLSRRRLDV